VCQVCYDKLLSSLSESLLVDVFGSVLLERRIIFCAQRFRYDSAAVAATGDCNIIVCYLLNSNSLLLMRLFGCCGFVLHITGADPGGFVGFGRTPLRD